MKPLVAIVGRANVGKSTLFNRLAGSRVAIVEDLPGTTRDRIFVDAAWQGREMTLIDTGGLDPVPDSPLGEKVKYQVEAAIAEADVIIFLSDIGDGVITTDLEIADWLRGCDRPIVLAANKADNLRLESQTTDFYRLGLGVPLAISAHHGRGLDDLMDRVVSLLPQPSGDLAEPVMPKFAIVGRPNVGKSMLLNAIMGEERAVVDHVPGTTRDAVDTICYRGDQELLLIDTAGIRRRGRIGSGIEYYSLLRSMHAIDRCDVALLVTDATEFLTAQDVHVAGYVREASKGMVLLVNKWDLVPKGSKREYVYQVEQRLKFMSHVPVLYVSAKLRQGTNQIMGQAQEIWDGRQKHLPDPVVDKLIKEAVVAHAPPRVGLRQLEIARAYQVGVNPPTFVFLVNNPKLVHFSYQRYLENRIRQVFDFSGTPLRLIFKKAPHRKLRAARQQA